MADHGYDVADPRDVDPLFGDLAAFDALIAEAHALDIRVTIDLVPNHTSDLHEWFQAALRAGPGSPERARYIFRDGRGPTARAAEQLGLASSAARRGPACPTASGTCTCSRPEQPDLNWDNPEVVADLEQTLRFWLDRGVDGFRIDVAHGMAKPDGLPDMDDRRRPPACCRDDATTRGSTTTACTTCTAASARSWTSTPAPWPSARSG